MKAKSEGILYLIVQYHMTINTKEKRSLDELQPNSIHGPNTSIRTLRKSQRTQAFALNALSTKFTWVRK